MENNTDNKTVYRWRHINTSVLMNCQNNVTINGGKDEYQIITNIY